MLSKTSRISYVAEHFKNSELGINSSMLSVQNELWVKFITVHVFTHSDRILHAKSEYEIVFFNSSIKLINKLTN